MILNEVTLVGRKEEATYELKHPLLERLEGIRKRLGYSRERFAVEKLRTSNMTYYRWLREGIDGLTLRRIQELEALADRLEAELEEKGG